MFSVRNVPDQIKDISYFFNLYQERQKILDSNIDEHCPEFKRKKLKDVCRTHWVECVKFEELFMPLVCTFEQMSINLNKKSNRDTSSKAPSFLKLVASFDFIVALVITPTE